MYTALYRTYRPETFEEILGQDHIVKILRNQIQSDSVNHAYLFCGTRGTGKTTTARILAKGVNCLSNGPLPCGICNNCRAISEGVFIDVIEIDAASNNGVDNIREIRESVKYPPAVGRKKVYIIDEVHMLSTGAFNALLKTLEEPPDNVMFILATTEPQKLPATILSRCMRLDFRRVSENLLRAGMAEICRKSGVEITDAALGLIAANADGSVRDSLSLLDQCLSAGNREISREDVLVFLGTAGEEIFIEMTEFVASQAVDKALLLLGRVLADGKDVRQLMRDWLAHYRSLLIVKFIQRPEDILNMSYENVERIRVQSERLPLSEINRAILEISKMTAEAKWSTQPRILLELCIVKLAVQEAEEREESGQRRKNPAGASATAASMAAVPPSMAAVAATVPMPGGTEDALSKAGPAKTAASDPDNAKLWDDLFQGADGLSGSFNVIRGSAGILSLSATTCVVEAQKEYAKDFIEKNKRAIEELLEKRTGVKRVLECRICEQQGMQASVSTVEKIAEDLGSRFGLNIEIEE